MVHLLSQDVLTKEVLDWKGVHLLHFMGSSCSQKTRIFLNLKGIDWTSHHVDLTRRENASDWFMGINPRGLVPVLVHDGQVIIESNDILEYLENEFPIPSLIPEAKRAEVHDLLAAEDALHLDLRAISLRYLFGEKVAMRSKDDLKAYENAGSGQVGGKPDAHKQVEIKFFEKLRANNGISDEQIRDSAGRFKTALDDLNARLTENAYLLGDDISTIDIAWYIYCARLTAAGYPLHKLHPKVGAWFDGLNDRPKFRKEVAMPLPLLAMRDAMHQAQQQKGETLVDIAKL